MKKPDISLTDEEKQLLEQLHEADGAWTEVEFKGYFPDNRLREIVAVKLLLPVATDIGHLFLLSVAGQHAVFGTLRRAYSLERQVNLAYVRLALAALGWRECTSLESRNLQRFDVTGELTEVMTSNGNALFNGKLTGRGFSRRHIGRVAERLKSQALLHNFNVILAVPNGARGRKAAEKHSSFLRMIEVQPQTTTGRLVTRLHHPAPPRQQPSDGIYLAGEAWKTDPQYAPFPAHILNILQQDRASRIEAALQSIEVDGVMSAALLRRFYGLETFDLPTTYGIRTTIRTSPLQVTSEVYIEFVTLSRRLALQADSRLAHRAGTGCMRHLLDIPPDPERYKAEFRGQLKLESPDALWTDNTGNEIALEYDNGTYSVATIQSKLETFNDRGFQTVWGVSHARRQQKLSTLFGQQLHGQVLLAEWWK